MKSAELKDYTAKGISYQTYLNDIEKVISTKSCSADMCEYYDLNYQRMKRLNKKIQLSADQINRLQAIGQKVYFLVITEGWCGDAAQIIPVIQKMVQLNDKLELKIVYRDENDELMDRYLTNGSKSIPIVIGADSLGRELFVWGPRPEFGNAILKQYKEGNFTIDEFKVTLQKQYNKDKGNSIINELLSKLQL